MSLAAITVAITVACSANAPNDQCRVVDGDTIWLGVQGRAVKVRVIGYDTPEPRTNVCGGRKEKKLAAQATARFTELLNSGHAKVHFIGRQDRYQRELADITINGEDVGDILVREKLARYWPDGPEFWCN